MRVLIIILCLLWVTQTPLGKEYTNKYSKKIKNFINSLLETEHKEQKVKAPASTHPRSVSEPEVSPSRQGSASEFNPKNDFGFQGGSSTHGSRKTY